MSYDATFTVHFDGQPIEVRYTKDYFAGHDHFEFVSPYNPPKPIPVSETGYRSRFVPGEEVLNAARLELYAQELLVALMNAGSPINPDQFTLF